MPFVSPDAAFGQRIEVHSPRLGLLALYRALHWLLSYAWSISTSRITSSRKTIDLLPKYFFYAFFIVVAPLLVLRFRSLIVVLDFAFFPLGVCADHA